QGRGGHCCGRRGFVGRGLRGRFRKRHLGHPVSRGRAATRPLLRVRRVLLDCGCADARLRPVARLTLDGVPAAELAARWGVPQCGLFRQLTSTLDAIHDLGAHAAPAGTTVLAEEQSAGRGRDGRTWHSPPGGVWLGRTGHAGGRRVGRTAVRDRRGRARARVGGVGGGGGGGGGGGCARGGGRGGRRPGGRGGGRAGGLGKEEEHTSETSMVW